MSSDFTTTILPLACCPACTSSLSAATGRGAPRPGDLSLCWSCGEVLSFDQELVPRRFGAAELASLDAPTRLWVLGAQRSLRLARASKVVAHA